jgi:formylglycine-generating enzyme required for sulfatase activity
MIGAGRADESYLSGWDGATPPAGQADRLVVNVTWRAASDFCRDRGTRLPTPTDAPTSWAADAASPTAELRQTEEGGPAAVMFDGQRVPTGARSVVPDAGFRCLRR